MDDYPSIDRTSVSTSTITAFFDDRLDADRAVERLRSSGVPNESIRVTEGTRASQDTPDHRSGDGRGFFEMLGDFFFPDEDRTAYAEGLSRGGHLVTATGLSGDLYDTALDILDDDGAIDIDERSAVWRAEGWSGTYDDPAEDNSSLRGEGADYDADRPGFRRAQDGGISREGFEVRDNGSREESSPVAAAMASAVSGVPGVVGRKRDLPDEAQMMLEEEMPSVSELRAPLTKRDTTNERKRVRSYLMDEQERDIDDEMDGNTLSERDINRP